MLQCKSSPSWGDAGLFSQGYIPFCPVFGLGIHPHPQTSNPPSALGKVLEFTCAFPSLMSKTLSWLGYKTARSSAHQEILPKPRPSLCPPHFMPLS